jgi:hypothetical protein
MDQILLYQKITDIKPDYRQLTIPSQKPSIKKVQFTLKELELHYYEEFKAYLTASKIKKITGGDENQKITVIEMTF